MLAALLLLLLLLWGPLLLRIRDLLVSLFFQLFQRDVGPDARLLLLNRRAVDGFIEVNGGVVVELAQAAAAFCGQVLAALVQEAEVVRHHAKPAHELAPGGKGGRLPVEAGGHVVVLRVQRFQVVRDLVAVQHRVVLV